MKKSKTLKVFALSLVVVMLVAVSAVLLVACSAPKDNYADIFAVYTPDSQLITTSTESKLGDDVTVYNVTDDFVVYDQGDVKDNVMDLKTGAVVAGIGNKDNVSVDVAGEGVDLIEVVRNFTENETTVQKKAIFSKAGVEILGFNKNLISAAVNPLKDQFFSVNGDLYNGSTVVATGNNFSVLNDSVILSTENYAGNLDVTVYNFDGSIVYNEVFASNNDVSRSFAALSAETGFVMTTTAVSSDSKDYTYSEDGSYKTQKYSLKYELIDFKSGKKSEIKLGYVIAGGVQRIADLDEEYKRAYTEKAQGYVATSGYAINADKTLSGDSTFLFADNKMNIKASFDNANSIVRVEEDKYVVRSSAGTVTVVNGKNEVLKRFGDVASTGAIKTVKVGDNWYDLDGKMIVNSADYDSLGSGFYAGFISATKDSENGYIDETGKFVAMKPADGSAQSLGATVYSTQTKAQIDDGKDVWNIVNFAGTTVTTVTVTEIVDSYFSGSSIYAAYLVKEVGTTTSIIALRVE